MVDMTPLYEFWHFVWSRCGDWGYAAGHNTCNELVHIEEVITKGYHEIVSGKFDALHINLYNGTSRSLTNRVYAA
ncbi:MAG: hypothetical protein V2B19_15190 [Pseudomonadota bacterium]